MKAWKAVFAFLAITSCTLGPGLFPGDHANSAIDPGGGVGGTATLGVFSPAVGTKGTRLTITGDHFVDGATVTIGGTACASVSVKSATELTCVVPGRSPGTGKVSVTNPGGSEATFSEPFTSKVFLHAISGSSLHAFEVTPSTGALVPVSGSPYSTGTGPRIPRPGPTGNLVYVPNGINNTVTAFKVDPETGVFTTVTGSPFATCTIPESISISADGLFLFSFCSNGSERLARHRADVTTGVLSGATTFSLTAPIKHSAITPDGKYLFLGRNSATIEMYSVDATTGTLTELPDSPKSGLTGEAVGMTVIGSSFLYFNAGTSGIDGYRINPDGSLTQIAGMPYDTSDSRTDFIVADSRATSLYAIKDTGTDLRGFSMSGTGAITAHSGNPYANEASLSGLGIDPGGSFVFLSVGSANKISVYSRDASSGALTKTSEFSLSSAPGVLSVL